MKSILNLLVLALCVGAMSNVAWGQGFPIEGDFRSHQKGNWDDPYTWERFSEVISAWVWPAPHIPSSADRRVLIDAYFTGGDIDTVRVNSSTAPVQIDELTVDGVLIIEAGGAVTVLDNPADPFDIRGIGKVIQMCGGILTTIGNGDWENLDLIPCPNGTFTSSTLTGGLNNLGEITVQTFKYGDGGSGSVGDINNSGEITIAHRFEYAGSGGSVTGNPFRYGPTATLLLNNPEGTIIDSASVLWPSTNGPVRVDARGPITMNVPRTVPYFIAADSVTNAYNLSFNQLSFGASTVTVDSGGFFDSSPLYSENVTLVYHGAITYNVGDEWASGTSVGRGVPDHVVIHDANVNMPNGPRRCPRDLAISGGALILSTAAGANLSVGGNWASYGTLIPNSKEVIFDGTTEQHISGAPRATFGNLTINNSVGIFLNGNMEVTQTLTFLTGNLTTYGLSGPLILSGDVVGASPTSHVLTIGTGYGGRVIRTIAGGDSFQFPIGATPTTYNPLTITLDPSDPVETFSVSVASAATPPFHFVQPIWNIRETTEGGNHAALTFQWSGAEEGAGFNRNASSTYYSGGGANVEVVQNSIASGTDPYIVSTTGGFPCTEFHPSSQVSAYTVGNASATAIEESKEGIPTSFTLSQNYPNPFNPTTEIRYALPRAEKVNIVIYNDLGQQIKTLVSQNQPAGDYKVIWDASNDAGQKVGSGMYFYLFKAGEFRAVKKMILLR